MFGGGALSMPTLVQRVRLDTSSVKKGVAEINVAGTSLSSFFGKIKSLGPAAAVITAGVALSKLAGDVSKMRRVIQQESGATGKDLAGLFDTAKRTATQVPAKFDDISAAVSELHRRGVPLGATFDKLAKQELFLAKITKGDVATTVEQTTGLFDKFNVPLREQSRELDVLFKATQLSGKGLTDLLGPLQSGGTQLQTFGFDLDHSIALVAGLTRAGVNVAPVLSSLRRAFGSIAKEGKDPQKVLAGLVKELTGGKPKAIAMADALKILGNRGGAELARAIQQGKFDVADVLKIITNGKDGIIATGEATLTLGDRFTLLKNRAAIALFPIGNAIRSTFVGLIDEITPGLSATFSSIAHFAQSIAPALAPIGIAFVATFRSVGPILTTFARGLDGISSLLDHFPAPVLAAVGSVIALYGAFRLLSGGAGLVGAAKNLSSFLADLNPVTASLVIVAATITAVGAAMAIFGAHSKSTAADVREMSQAVFDAESSTSVFADGVTSASTGLAKFLNTQFKAGKDPSLLNALSATGNSISDVVKHLDDGDKAWDKYKTNLALTAAFGEDAAKKFGKGASAHDDVTASLDKERDAFQKNARTVLASLVADKQLKQSDLDLIESRRKNSDGTIRYGEVLDRVNQLLGDTARATDAAAEATTQSAPDFRALTDLFGQGAISADSMASILQEKYKFSVEGAKAKTKELTDDVKALGSAVDAAFPNVADAAKGLKGDIAAVQADLVNRTVRFGQNYRKANSIAGGATGDLKNTLHDDYAAIQHDLHALATNTDPETFTQNLIKQAQTISSFFGNLHTLVSEGFGPLARQLLALGAQAGGGLAAGFASDENKAKAGNAAAVLLERTKAAARASTLSHLGEFYGFGKQLGAKTGDGTADGIKGSKPKIEAAAKGAVDDAGAAAKSRHPALTAALRFLAARASEAYKPSLTAPTTTAIGGAVQTIQRSGVVKGALTAHGKAAATGFHLPIAGPVGVALEAAGTKAKTDRSVPGAMGIAGAKGATEFKHRLDVAGGARQQFNTATTTIRTLTGIAIEAGRVGHAVGVAFTSGLAQGLIEDVGSLRGVATQIAHDVETTLKAAWGITSPSKVARRIGGQWTQGLGQGLDQPQLVEKPMRRIAKSVNDGARHVVDAARGIGQSFVVELVRATDVRGIPQTVGQLNQLTAAATALKEALAADSGSGGSLGDLVSTITGQLPTAGTVISNFETKRTEALSKTRDDLRAVGKAERDVTQARVRGAAEFAKAISLQQSLAGAQLRLLADTNAHAPKSTLDADRALVSQATKDSHAANTEAGRGVKKLAADEKALGAQHRQLASDQRVLRAASDPANFIRGINRSNNEVRGFQVSLSKLSKRFPELAAELAKQGPDIAGNLAKAFAHDPKKAKAAEQALIRQGKVSSSFGAAVNRQFGTGALTGTGESVAQGLIDGMIHFIEKSGGKVAKGVVDPIKQLIESLFGVASPSKWARGVGEHVGDGLVDGLAARRTEAGRAADQLVTHVQGRLSKLRAADVKPIDVRANVVDLDAARKQRELSRADTPPLKWGPTEPQTVVHDERTYWNVTGPHVLDEERVRREKRRAQLLKRAAGIGGTG